LTRALYETTFVLGALEKRAVTPEELGNSDMGHRRKIGRALMVVAGDEVPPEHRDRMGEFIAEHQDAKVLTIESLAQRAGLQILYDGMYRNLSHFAAHPSVTAASGYFVEDPEGNGSLVFKPLTGETTKALASACEAILLACGIYERIGSPTPELNGELHSRVERSHALQDKYKPWAVKQC
jgi:hypothetical protein